MEFNVYQENARQFANYHKEVGPFSVILSLVSNVGNLSNKLYYALEGNEGGFSDEEKLKVAISLGDIVYDISNIAADLQINFDEIIALNLKKLEMAKEQEIKSNNHK